MGKGVVIHVELEGWKETAEKIRELGPKLGRRVFRKALTAVGDYWIPEVQSRTPSDDGALKNSIIKTVKTRKVGNDGDIVGTVEVGPNMRARRTDGKKSVGPGIYAMFVEYGLKNRDYKPHPFMRPTFDTTWEKAVQVFAKTLKEALEDVVKE